jgi:hypothetical protein
MLRLRMAFKAFWITALICFVALWSVKLPSFSTEPPPPVPYGFDDPIIYTLADVPRLLLEITTLSFIVGMGSLLGATLSRVKRHLRSLHYVVTSVLSILLAFVGVTLSHDVLPTKWVIWAMDNAPIWIYIYEAAWMVALAALTTWLCLRWANRRESAYA